MYIKPLISNSDDAWSVLYDIEWELNEIQAELDKPMASENIKFSGGFFTWIKYSVFQFFGR